MTRIDTKQGRTAQGPSVADFDEQLWPVNSAIIILAGFLVGIICAQSDFSSAQTGLLENGYVHLGIVALLMWVLLWAVTWLKAKMVRRVQLCILFSLLVHLGLAVYLHGQYLAMISNEGIEEKLEFVRYDELIIVPDYPWHHPDRPHSVESFERPVATEAPDELGLEPVERHPTEQEAVVERPDPVEPEPAEEEPEPVELRRAELSPPERAEEVDDEISRQQSSQPPEPDDLVAVPEIPLTRAIEPPEPVRLEPKPLLAQRQLALPEAARQTADESLLDTTSAIQSPTVLAQRAVASQEELPNVDLSQARPITLARADVGVDLPSATRIAADATAPARTGGAAPSSIEVTSSVAAVRRSESRALKRPNTAAAGAAEFALGSSAVRARLGEPRALGDSYPSGGPHAPPRQIARSAVGTPIPTTPSPQMARVPAVSAASGGGGPPSASPDAQGTPVGWAGSVGIPRPARATAAGSGPASSPGMSGPSTAAYLARVTGLTAFTGAQAGGGDPMPARKFGRAFSSDATVEVPRLAAGPPSGGVAAGPQSEIQASGQAQQVPGPPGTLPSQPRLGALAALTDSGPRLPTAVARRAIASQEVSGRVGTSPANSATLAKAETGPNLPAAVAPLEDVPVAGAGGAATPPGAEPSLLQVRPDTTLRPTASAATSVDRIEGRLTARIVAAEGPDGLSPGALPLAGIANRRPRPESDHVRPVARLLVVKRSGVLPVIDGRVRQAPVDAFRQRDPSRRPEAAKRYGSTEGSERAVEIGLDFLARHQFPDGHWSLDRFPPAGQPEHADAALGQMRADTAATGLALLAFLGAGYTHIDNKHHTVVRKGIDWLLENQQPDGQLFTIPTDTDRPARIYGHGIGAIALCEAYGMTRDPGLREPAQQAIQFIIDAQHPVKGGWRYTPNEGETTWRKESDTSVSGWQLMALKSAQMAGLDVPDEVMERVGRWLDLAQADGGSRYMYNPYASTGPEQRQGLTPNRAMTAEGLLMRMYLGWDRDNPAMIGGADYLQDNLPELGDSDHPLRDVYYWYYATQVMFQMQGHHWAAWNDRLRPLLAGSQVQQGPLAGSWHPNRPAPDRWAHAGGRLYVTTLNLLMLEVYYRYLPLFRTLADDVVLSRE